MPGKKELYNRQVAGAVLARFRDGKGVMVMTGEELVAKLHEALVALGDPLDYRVSLELLKSFGFVSETFGFAYFADVKPKLDKVVGAIVHNTLVSVEANTAAQKAAVLLLLTQNAETYHKACVSAKDAAELLSNVLDISSTPQQTPQQITEAELGELGELAKLPPLHDEMPTEQASPETQRSGGADDAPPKPEDERDEEMSDQEPQDPAQDQPQAPAQDPPQAERAANKRPRQTGGYQAKSKRKKQQMSTFFVVGARKISKRAAAQQKRADAKEKLKRSAKFKLIGRVPNDAAQQLPAAERTVEPVEPGYLLAPVQSVDYLFKYAIRDTTTGDAVIRFFDKDRLFARKLPGGRVFWPHIGLVNACMTPGKWCKRVADDNYCYYPTADEVAATVAVYGAAFNVLIHSTAATAPRSGSGSSSDSGSGSGNDSGNDSGDDSGNDE